jgi:cystathionine gamma-lyase
MGEAPERREPGLGTRAVHAGLPPAQQGAPFLPGPTFAAPFHLAGDPRDSPFGYGRYSNPTWEAYERAIGELEGGRTTVFASGMAACSAVLLEMVPGDVLVAPSDGYPMVRTLAAGHLAERGVETRLVPTAGDWIGALDGAALVWLETPSNPGLDVCDVTAVTAAAHERKALVALDNTLATPLGQRALELGCDFAVSADTKATSGHADLLLGHVATASDDLAKTIRSWRSQTGSVPGPFETWLAHRSLATLDVRLDRQCANAMAVAGMLAARDDVHDVRYPGLPTHPAHEVAARQMRRFGMVVSFTLESAARAQRFFAESRLVFEATSFGGVHSTGERRARWGHGDDVAEGFIRLSVGCEETADLVADLQGALDASGE